MIRLPGTLVHTLLYMDIGTALPGRQSPNTILCLMIARNGLEKTIAIISDAGTEKS
jgi:hypothetical protein